MTEYRDLFELEEDERITTIGETAMRGNRTVFMVEDDGQKADRYIAKLRERFPRAVISGPLTGPVPGVVTVAVGPPGSGPH